MTKQMTKIAMMLVLAIGLMAGAASAQIPVGIYTGIETAQGTCEAMTDTCYGNTFALNSFGESETYHLTVSQNYVDIQNHVGGGLEVTGGTWSLVVYRDNAYAGTLYGEVQTGTVNIITNNNGEEVSKQVQANLLSIGGSGIFAGKDGENIGGVYNAITDLRSKETSGSASFSF